MIPPKTGCIVKLIQVQTINVGVAVGSTLFYCYGCTNDGFVKSSTPAASWIAFKGAYIQDNPSRKTIDGCVQWSHEHITGQPVGTKLSFQMNHASICGTMMVAFVLDAMPVNAAF
ncbi:hypothetical protein TNCV_2237721 [Trichonephila clavipes]|nr:hypothetical protein TNCV_2237721 [Trichonephila clavipes]